MSYTVNRKAWNPDVAVPYVIAIVKLDEGPKMMTKIVNGRCGIGDRVRLVWERRGDKPPIALFEPEGVKD